MTEESRPSGRRWFAGEYAPPQSSEIEWLRDALGRDPHAGILIRADSPAHRNDPAPGVNPAVPMEKRVSWMGQLFPGREIRVGSGAGLDSASVPDSARRVEPARLRDDVLSHWDELPQPVRPDYLVRVAIMGPESVGKSTLARDLAEHLGGRDVQEYAREAYPWGDPTFRARPEHMVEICVGHGRWIHGAERAADRYLISDTEAITTLIWSESYLGEVPDEVVEAARTQEFDLYLLLDLDVPWVADGIRTWEHARQAQFERVRDELEARGLPYTIISGGWTERFEASLNAIRQLGAPQAPMGCPERFPAAGEQQVDWGARFSAE